MKDLQDLKDLTIHDVQPIIREVRNLFEGGVEVLDILMVVGLPDVSLVALRPTLAHVFDFSGPLFVFALHKVYLTPCIN